MPELPEVETVRAGLADHSLGRPVRAVRVVDARSLRRHLPVRCAGTCPAPPASRRRSPAERCAVPTGAASTCG